MLSNWGYLYFHIGQGLGYAELDLQKYRAATAAPIGVASPTPSTIESHNPIIAALYGHLSTIGRMVEFQELGTIPRDAETLKAKIDGTRKKNPLALLFVDEILSDVQRLQNDFRYILEKRKFYSISPELVEHYGKPELFGVAVTKRFSKASDDIESAGNCLALGEPTACVLHLNRAMEIAIHGLARKLHIIPDAKDNMGSILRKMTEPINILPDKT